MTLSQSFLAHWYFHVPNALMAALIWLSIARLALEPLGALGRSGILVGTLRALTAPAVAPARWLTPRIIPDALVPLLAIGWLMAARMVWFMACTAAGMRLSVGS